MTARQGPVNTACMVRRGPLRNTQHRVSAVLRDGYSDSASGRGYFFPLSENLLAFPYHKVHNRRCVNFVFVGRKYEVGYMGTAAKYKPNVEIAPDAESAARKSVDVFVADAKKAISAKDVFYVAVSGGHTPRRFFELLGEIPEVVSLPWDKIQLFWVDERYVPPDSEWSNYKLAAETFLDKVAIPQPNIHRIPTECGDFKVAARS